MTRLGGWGVPGAGALDITSERNLLWGYGSVNYLAVLKQGLIAGGSVDAGNTSFTNVLRPGLVLGLMTNGKYSQYNPAGDNSTIGAGATAGANVASAVLFTEVLAQDFTATSSDRVCPVLVSGPVQASQLIGLDSKARAQMARMFLFDDDLIGNRFAPARFQTKTGDYTVTTADNGTVFDTTGAGAAVAFTLPSLATPKPGLWYKFYNCVDQNMSILSGGSLDDFILFNDLTSDGITFVTAGNLIGATAIVYTNALGTKWFAEIPCKHTLTVA